MVFLPNSAEASITISEVEKVVGSSCYVYSTTSASTKYRSGYLTFGETVDVLMENGTWTQIETDGEKHYILSKNLKFKEQTIIKNRVMVSPGAYACSKKSTLGYVFYGTDVQVLDEEISKKGVTYVHCVIPKTYEADGTTLQNENVEGYINKAYLREKSVVLSLVLILFSDLIVGGGSQGLSG